MNWTGVTIHHSASRDVSANEIDRWHRERGWKEIGYHFVIRADGSIEPARNWSKHGAHNRGRNTTHLGICLTGHFGKNEPTPEQLTAAVFLCRGLKTRFGLREFVRHHEECPGDKFPWCDFLNRIERALKY